MSNTTLQVYVEDQFVNTFVCGEDNDGGVEWALPLSTYATDRRDGMPKPTPPALDPEQLTVWAARLRVVAQQLDDLAAEMQPQVCFPTMGMEEVG